MGAPVFSVGWRERAWPGQMEIHQRARTKEYDVHDSFRSLPDMESLRHY
jgi:hypothetical protein